MTAEEFTEDDRNSNFKSPFHDPKTHKFMVDYARFHVKRALEEAARNTRIYESSKGVYKVDLESIINSYPLSIVR